MEAMRDIDKFQLMCNRVAELSEEVSKLTSTNDSLLRDLRDQRADAKSDRDVQERRHERDRDDWNRQMESLKTSYEDQIARLLKDHKEQTELLLSEIQSLKLMLKSSRGKQYGGGKSERLSSIEKRSRNDEEHRDDEENRYDGTPESLSDDVPQNSSESSAKNESDLIKKLQRDIRRGNRNAEVKVERTDYSKATSYGPNVIYHSLDEYFSLSEGERFVMRNGEIDKTCLRVVIRHPEVIEEHIYECATVISRDNDDYKTSDLVETKSPIYRCLFGNSMLSYILDEKYHRNKPLSQIVEQLNEIGFNISDSTLGDNIHRALGWLAEKMLPVWEKVMRLAKYWMLDETPTLVGCKVESEDGGSMKKYLKRYIWCIRAECKKLVLFLYEGGRGAKAIEPYLSSFIGFYTTDGYQVYKLFDEKDDDENARRKRSGCMTHIRRPLVDALVENYEEAMWFLERIAELFGIEYDCKKRGLTDEQRLLERLKRGSTVTIMDQIERRLLSWKERNYTDCGPLMKKALTYALNEWPAMKRILENGDVEISNNLSYPNFNIIQTHFRRACA